MDIHSISDAVQVRTSDDTLHLTSISRVEAIIKGTKHFTKDRFELFGCLTCPDTLHVCLYIINKVTFYLDMNIFYAHNVLIVIYLNIYSYQILLFMMQTASLNRILIQDKF